MISALYTWRDVERILRSAKDPPWIEASADLEALTIQCAESSREEAWRRLLELFDASLSEEKRTLKLESTVDAPRHLEVVFDTAPEDGVARQRIVRPLWPDAERTPPPPPPLPEGAPRVGAFYSYKGGVGRTTTLLAALGAFLDAGRPVLVIDADLEAPGLTLEIPGAIDRFCLLDYLALLHDAEDWRSVVPLAADRVRRNVEHVELPTGRARFHFVPSYRCEEQLFAQPVTFEQLVRGRGRAHIVAEALAELGRATGAEAVLVDLRAGVTELSSPLLLDPRVQTIVVTSCGRQSIEGTVSVLGRMRARVRRDTSPEVVLTMIPNTFKPKDVAEIEESLEGALPVVEEGVAEGAARPSVHEVAFNESLLHFDSVEMLLRDVIPSTDLGRRSRDRRSVAETLAELISPPAARSQEAPNERAAAHGLRAVADQARSLEYAEGNAELGLLVTPALAALVEQFPDGSPAAVVLGAKGAGKTFAWGQMVLARTWQSFSSLVAPGSQRPRASTSPTPTASVFPLLGPSNMRAELATKVSGAEKVVWERLGSAGRPPMTGDALHAELGRWRGADTDELEFWTRRAAARLGLDDDAGASVESLAGALATRGVAVYLVVDGLEDAFQPTPEAPLHADQQRLLRGLLQRFTNQVRAVNSRHLGVVTFVRRDLAQSAIAQNFGQFEALHTRLAIVWTPTEALRLVAWLLDRAKVHYIDRDRIPVASYEELRAGLTAFWGEKLGSERSREPSTDRWVMAALSDFQGRLQARDLVRLIRYAAESVPDEPRLTPKSLRDALAKSSTDKIRELETEIRGLRPLFDEFRIASEDKRKVPFHAADFALTPEQVSFLETQGIVIREEQGDLYLPEIVRQGLGFRLEGGRRAKVLALYRAAQAKRV
jgi:MinD-like ATPase involved in chromosome partitioning or flagellar assembly